MSAVDMVVNRGVGVEGGPDLVSSGKSLSHAREEIQ